MGLKLKQVSVIGGGGLSEKKKTPPPRTGMDLPEKKTAPTKKTGKDSVEKKLSLYDQMIKPPEEIKKWNLKGGGKVGKPIKYAIGGQVKPAWMRNK